MRRTIPSAALLVLGLVALLVAVGGGFFMIKAAGGSSWGAQAAADPGAVSVKANGNALFNDSLLATAEVPAGPTTFQVSTTSARGDNVLLVRLTDKLTITQFLHDLSVVSGSTTANGENDVTKEVENLGGALVTPQCAVNFTVNVAPGTYYLIHFRGTGISDAHPTVQELRTTGAGSNAPLPAADQEIVLEETSGAPRFQASNKLPADGTYHIVNRTDNTNETAFLPLKPGKADSDLSAYFADLSKADWKNAPFAGGPCGLAPINPGRDALVHLSMTPGSFVLASFAYDVKAKKRNAELGMYQRVTFGP
ncbi:MAG: hypothetical protein ACJ72N_02540 [Labedaea sp.]